MLEALAVLEVEEAVDDAAAVAGMEESAAAVVKVAVKPVTFVQAEGTVAAVPETKFTAAHCFVVNVYLDQEEEDGIYLIQKSINGILHDANDAFRASPRSWNTNIGLAESSESILAYCWE